jgi:hypothetical protein
MLWTLMLRFFNPKYMLFWCVRNFAFRRALSTEQYQSALIVGLLCWPSCTTVQGFALGTGFVEQTSLDTVVSIGMRRPTHLQKRDQVLVFRWHLRVSDEGSTFLELYS